MKKHLYFALLVLCMCVIGTSAFLVLRQKNLAKCDHLDSTKWRSIQHAFAALSDWSPDETDVFRETLRNSDDVDFLRVVAMAAGGAAYPMEAGDGVTRQIDDCLYEIFMTAAKRLCELPSSEADHSRWLLFNGFTLDASLGSMYQEAMRELLDRNPGAPDSIGVSKGAELLFGELFVPATSFGSLSPSQIALYKNQIMDDLLDREDIPDGYAIAVETLCRNRSNDAMLRGFAVQHLPLYAEALARRGQFDSASQEAARVRETLFDAARETSTSVGGTALIALVRLSRTDYAVDKDALENFVLDTGRDSTANPATRLAAVQLCGTLHLSSAIPLLRSLSTADSIDDTLRLAARHALSSLESAGMPGE